ncbi:MAG: cache domain-containing protein [Anaerolineae bacterium]
MAAVAEPSLRRSLRAKIITWSFVPTAIILFAVALVNFYAYQRVTQDLVIERDQQLVRLSASQLSTRMDEYTETLAALVRSAEVYESDIPAQRAALQRAAKRLSGFDGGVVILSTMGTVVAAEPPRPAAMGEDWSDRAWFRQMLRTPEPVFSDVVFDGPDNSAVVVAAVPIVGYQGQFVGSLAGMFRVDPTALNQLFGSIALLRLDERGEAYIVDAESRVVWHSNAERIGTSMEDDAIAMQALSAGQGYFRTNDVSGIGVLANYAAIPGTSWHLVTQEAWTNLMSFSHGYRFFLLVLLAAGVAVPTLVVLVAAGRITRPIEDLIDAAKQVAGGNFGRTINAHTGDEIEELATQFNLMSAQLRESYATLEQKVADRTRELATLNSIATVVSQSLDLDEVMHSTLSETLAVMHMEAGAAYRLDPDGQTLTMMAHQGISPELVEMLQRDARLPVDMASNGFTSASPDVTVRTATDLHPGALGEALAQDGLRLVLRVPLMTKGRVVGLVHLASRAPRSVSAEERSLLLGIGHQAGLAVENARLYEQAEQAATAAERSRLARDLHDAVTQTLFSASLVAEVLPRLWERNAEEGQRRLEQLRQLTRGALAEMRTLLLELRPTALTEAPLPDLLRQLAEACSGRSQVRVSVEAQGEYQIGPDVQVAFYRIAQEALNNTVKHSGAKQVRIALVGNSQGVSLTIRDDGTGFDVGSVSGNHLGLGIMRERAEAVGAEIEIHSTVGVGTEVSVIWTLDDDE